MDGRELHAGPIVERGKGVVGGRAFVFNGKWGNVEVTGLVQGNRAAYRLQQLHGVVADTSFEHHLDFANIRDAGGGIAVDHHEVGLLAGGNGPDVVELAEELRSVGSRDLDGLRTSESRLYEQLDIALVGEPG